MKFVSIHGSTIAIEEISILGYNLLTFEVNGKEINKCYLVPQSYKKKTPFNVLFP